jgi:hypothetical protein
MLSTSTIHRQFRKSILDFELHYATMHQMRYRERSRIANNKTRTRNSPRPSGGKMSRKASGENRVPSFSELSRAQLFNFSTISEYFLLAAEEKFEFFVRNSPRNGKKKPPERTKKKPTTLSAYG